MAYSLVAFRRDLEIVYRQGLRTARLGWYRRLMFALVRKPADWRRIHDQAVRDLTNSHAITVQLLDGVAPFLSAQERNGTTEIGTTRLRELAGLARIDRQDAERMIDLYSQFSNEVWRTNLMDKLDKARTAEVYGFVAGLWVVAVLGICAASLFWAIHRLSS